MTKKDFQVIARAIYRARKDDAEQWEGNIRGNIGITVVVREVANALAKANPRFDRERFVEACETGACKGMKA